MATPSTDSAAIRQILGGLLNEGYTLSHVWDGDEEIVVKNVNEAVEAVMSGDMAHVYVKTPAGEYGWVWFVLGDSPEEVAADYTTNLDPALGEITSPWWSRI